MTIVEFLEARITEDELAAHAAIDASPEWQAYYDYRDVKDLDGHFVVRGQFLAEAASMTSPCERPTRPGLADPVTAS